MQSCSRHNIFDKLYSYNTPGGRLVREAVADYLLEKKVIPGKTKGNCFLISYLYDTFLLYEVTF